MLKKLVYAFVVISLFICGNTFASTKEELISAINKTYTVGDETFRLPQKIITKAENYLNKNPLSIEQYDSILRCIDAAVELAREKGTTDFSKFSKAEINKMLNILVEASSSANIDLEKELVENDISIPVNNSTKNEVEVNKNQIKNDNKPIQNNNLNQNSNINLESNNSSQNINTNLSEKKDSISSGELEDIESDEKMNSGEIINDIDLSGIITNKENIDTIIDKNVKIFVSILIIILFVIILLFYLILKAKWNKMIRCILIIIFVILIITVLVMLVLLTNYIEEIKLIYKLYYMFK